jgi:signal transduction histidine kinase/ActR/RegA family two-component response regulator
MIGMPIETLVPGLREQHARLRQSLAGGGEVYRMPGEPEEMQGLRKTGAAFPAEIDLAPVQTENGILIATAVEDIAPRKAIETALAASRNNLADALESIDRGVILYDKDDRVVIFNSRFRDHFPGPSEAIRVGATFEEIFRATVDRGAILVPEGMTKEAFMAERIIRHRRADGQPMTRRLADGRILQVSEHAARNGGIIGIGADVTEQLKIEEQLRAVQRMEAIGQLTGGMAHDFNNYLGVIVGNLDMLKESRGGDPVARRHVDAALQGALRAAELTQSLLAFSRRKRLDPQLTDLNARIESMAKLLGGTLGGGIAVVVAPAPDLWAVEVDAAQLDSCIVNVATNARDAMPGGGVLKIATRNETLDADYARLNAGVVPGSYALIEISDTGSGMSAATLERAFEPFFTTKGPGHGTGLGLSMVYGFVKQSGGHIRIYSEPNHGTTVRIYLPRSTAAGVVEYAAPRTAAASSSGGSETVLVVEDNEQLRATAAAQLASLGYRVLQAQDGHAALEILAQRGRHVDLLFSDVVMPGGLDGYSLAKLAVERRPDIKVLLTSGFPGEMLARIVADPKGFKLIGKPYRKEELARALRSALAS